MERIYAFTDEYGAFGWDLSKQDVSTHFIISAILVKESDLTQFRAGASNICKKEFQGREIKSKTTGNNHTKRQHILQQILQLPFSIFAICVDKQKCLDNMTLKGLRHKKTFYKFMNNIVHQELKRSFREITVVTDAMIDNDYLQSFCRYFEEHQDVKSLWGDADFQYQDSKNEVGVQVADYISGTLARIYDTNKRSENSPEYYQMLKDKLTFIEFYPRDYSNFNLDTSAIAAEYDKEIAELCFARAVAYIEQCKDDEDDIVKARVMTAKHLLFRFMNNNERKYISTYELIEKLKYAGLPVKSERVFRQEVVGKLRDAGVIIASCSKGYKIPAKESELYDYVNHDASILIPMLARLKKCREIIKLGTANSLDLLDHPEYKQLQNFFDTIVIPEE